VTQVAAGEEFGLALTATGRVLAWGGNSSGETGQPLPA
jgi:alpha-tubulin suppressor-like RCC1 family protein